MASYLHMPMVAGVVLVALGMKKVLESVGAPGDHELSDPLPLLPLIGLYAGVSLYLLAHSAFKYRTWHKVTGRRLAVAVLLGVLIPVAGNLPALAALGLLSVVLIAMIASETVQYSELREQVRHEDDPHEDDPVETLEQHDV